MAADLQVDPKTGYPIDPVTKQLLMSSEQRAALAAQQAQKKKGMLVVTTFCNRDIPILQKRIEWLKHLNVPPQYDLLLVGDHGVTEDDLMDIGLAHGPFFKEVNTRKIIDAPTFNAWPQNVNAAFRKTVRILTGQYGEKFSWAPYNGWFNYEADVTILVSDAFQQLESIYRMGNKPFAGYVNETRIEGGRLVKHLNGAAIYPTMKDLQARFYNMELMVENSLPWDVAGMNEKLLPLATPINAHKYLHAFGTSNYSKDGVNLKATQTLMTGTTQEKSYVLNGQILHHGCKDGSLVDVLLGKKKEPMTELKTQDVVSDRKFPVTDIPKEVDIAASIIDDKNKGMKWTALISKYKISPKKLKAILG